MSLSLNLGGVGSLAQEPYDVAIVGGGPAGATAALYAARANLRTVVLDKSASAGALALTSKIANFPGISGEITGAELLARMREQATGFGASFVQAQVMLTSLAGDPKEIVTSAGTFRARAVIIATGKMGRKQRVPGESEYLGRGVSYCATCDAAFFRNRTVVVLGASEHAVEESLFLTQFASEVKLLVPGDQLHASEEQRAALAASPKVTLQYRRPLREVVGDGSVVQGVRVGSSGGDEIVHASGVFIYLPGSAPILDFIGDALDVTEAGCIHVRLDRSTSIPGVFAAGDVLCSYLQQAVVAAADGAIAAMSAEKHVRGRTKPRSDWG
jgi:thioredoxin reductase (NADPH)